MGGGCEWFKKVCMKKPSFNYKIRRELFTRKKKVSKTHIQDKTENKYNQIEILTKEMDHR